jgi:Pyridoxamine 5'-phosphate oxidase
MSIPVPLDGLRAAIAERGDAAYLLTVTEDARPHAVHTPVRWEGDVLTAEVGKRTAANAARRPAVSLLFPMRAAGDYSLIIDGTAVVDEQPDGPRLRIAPTKAVLHRPAAAPDPASPCGDDCVPLVPPPSSRGSG